METQDSHDIMFFTGVCKLLTTTVQSVLASKKLCFSPVSSSVLIPSGLKHIDDKENYSNLISNLSRLSYFSLVALLFALFSFRSSSVSFQLSPTKQLRLQVLLLIVACILLQSSCMEALPQ